MLKLFKILDKEILDKEKLDKEKLDREKLDREKLNREKLDKEKLDKDKLDREKLDKEKLDKEKERRKGGKEEIIKKTLISLIKKGNQLSQGGLCALLRPLRSVHRQLSFNFASKGKQLL